MFELGGQDMEGIMERIHIDAVLGVLVGLTGDSGFRDIWLLDRKDNRQEHQCYEQHLKET